MACPHLDHSRGVHDFPSNPYPHMKRGPVVRLPPALVGLACGEFLLRFHRPSVDSHVVDQAGPESPGGHGPAAAD